MRCPCLERAAPRPGFRDRAPRADLLAGEGGAGRLRYAFWTTALLELAWAPFSTDKPVHS